MPPLSRFDYGIERILQPVLDALDPEVREAVQPDVDRFLANPANPGLPSWPWKFDEELRQPTVMAVLGGRIVVRYAVVASYAKPLIVNAIDLGDYLGTGA